ncbi:class II D-tagatose-bisphosphate aldolase non-catalytic subunit [Plantactinospora sp. CA-290183]|uniref:class II D-tagatose-bisphosphate aldolase non-catalytic subunit n=1 Tax=Plantactinospora sp. CA-290183 TaxID=3240006 RepID=UPI003D8AD9F6
MSFYSILAAPACRVGGWHPCGLLHASAGDRGGGDAVLRRRRLLLLDATSNQVDQLDGYPGRWPSDFRALVLDAAERGGTFEVTRS